MTPEQQMNVRYQIFETLVTSGLDGLTKDNLLPTISQVESMLIKEMVEETDRAQPSLNLVN